MAFILAACFHPLPLCSHVGSPRMALILDTCAAIVGACATAVPLSGSLLVWFFSIICLSLACEPYLHGMPFFFNRA